MDFFDRQEAARKSSRRLVIYFALAVIGVAAAVAAVVSGALALSSANMEMSGDGKSVKPDFWNAEIFLSVGGGTIVVILLGSLFKSMALSAGGSAVARSLGGRKIDSNTADADERKLLNVVEEMSIASGVPVPEVYLLEGEQGINAFAAGRTTSDAVIGATRGCVRLLSRDELQGVIAHEFSHILNGDMKLNLRLMGMLFGILMITIMGRVLLRSVMFSGHGHRRSSGNKDGGGVIAMVAFGVALVVVGYLGVLAANLIKAAVSRQREFLADSSAVQFTRNPDGIGGALKKIGGLSAGSRVEDAHAEEASHMFFACGLKSSMAGAFATHPPLEQRIRAIDPSWDGRYPEVSMAEISSSFVEEGAQSGGASAGMAAFAGGGQRSRGSVSLPAAGPSVAAVPASGLLNAVAVQGIGELNHEQVEHGRNLYASLPDHWVSAAHHEAGAQALVFAMLLAQDDTLRDAELELLRRSIDAATYDLVVALHGEFGDLHSSRKIALIDLAIPALRRLSPDEYERFGGLMQRLIESDRQVDLFEFMLQKIVSRHLDIYFNRRAPQKVRFKSLAPLADEASVLVSTLAFLGVAGREEGEASFSAGAAEIEPHIGGKLELKDGSACGLDRIDAALERFGSASPPVKKLLLVACGRAVMHDGVVASDEAELLRAIADTIDCPIPPFVAEPAAA
jgi:Zn-dependent protease with chaperone function